jgi:AraC-like DNA-binding protein
MAVSKPIEVCIPPCGVYICESIHGPDFQMACRTDPFHKLIFVYKGTTTYSDHRPAHSVGLAEGDMVLVPAGRTHGLEDIKPTTLFLLCLDPGYIDGDAQIQGLWRRIAAAQHLCKHVDSGAQRPLEQMWRRMIAEQQSARVGCTVALRAEASRLLVLFARSGQRRESHNARQRVAAVLAHVEDHFYEEWDLDAVAERAGISRRRFSQLCREITGKTFLESLTEWRLVHAARLLQGGEHTIIGAAFSSGFPDLSHFYRLFRKHFGKPPGAWLREDALD